MKLVSENDKKIIVENYPFVDTEELATMLGFSPSTIKQWAKKLGVKKQKGYIFHNCGKFTKEQKAFIHKYYSVVSNEELAKQINTSIENIQHYACAKCLKKRADLFSNINGCVKFFKEKRANPNYCVNNYLGKEQEPKVSDLYKSVYGKYAINQNYFEKIDNEWKAYWLGLLYADGWNSVEKTSIGLRLCLEDENHIKKFKQSLQAENKIYYQSPKNVLICGKPSYSQGSAGIVINNKKICNDLQKLGCVERKTYILEFPNSQQVPKHLIRHFLRGFFDGDGWVSVNKRTKVPSIGFVGMPSFILPLKEFLTTELNLTQIQPSQKNGKQTIEVDWASLTDVEKIYNYFYNNSNIYLPRKFEKLNKFYCLGQYEV